MICLQPRLKLSRKVIWQLWKQYAQFNHNLMPGILLYGVHIPHPHLRHDMLVILIIPHLHRHLKSVGITRLHVQLLHPHPQFHDHKDGGEILLNLS